MITIFIDLLGFSNNLNRCVSSSITQLDDFKYCFNEAQIDPNDIFHSFITFSDSVLLQVEDDKDFVPTLSEILYNTFMLNRAGFELENIVNNNQVEVRVFNNNGGFTEENFHWFPNLYRGGISILETSQHEFSGYIGSRLINSNFLLGPGIAEAVGFEKAIKGPKIYLNGNVRDSLAQFDSTKYFIQPTGIANVYQLNWTTFPLYQSYRDYDNIDEESLNLILINEYSELRRVVKNFELAFSDNERILEHYTAFGKLVFQGLHHFLDVKGVSQELINIAVNQENMIVNNNLN